MRLETWRPRVRKDIHTCHTAVSNGRPPFVPSLKVCTELHMWNYSCLTLKYMLWFRISSPFRGLKYCRVYHNITDSFHSKVLLYQKLNVSAEVYENPQSANCTKAVFEGSPMNLRKFRAGFYLFPWLLNLLTSWITSLLQSDVILHTKPPSAADLEDWRWMWPGRSGSKSSSSTSLWDTKHWAASGGVRSALNIK